MSPGRARWSRGQLGPGAGAGRQRVQHWAAAPGVRCEPCCARGRGRTGHCCAWGQKGHWLLPVVFVTCGYGHGSPQGPVLVLLSPSAAAGAALCFGAGSGGAEEGDRREGAGQDSSERSVLRSRLLCKQALRWFSLRPRRALLGRGGSTSRPARTDNRCSRKPAKIALSAPLGLPPHRAVSGVTRAEGLAERSMRLPADKRAQAALGVRLSEAPAPRAGAPDTGLRQHQTSEPPSAGRGRFLMCPGRPISV